MATLATIDPGTLFKADGVYAIKTEYFYPTGQCECVLLSSGEYAHFPQGNDTIVEITHFHTALASTQAELARLQATHADLLRVAQAAGAEARQQRGALRAALQSILAIAEARSDGTWDDVMRTARAALEGPTP
jgi:ElaB/YqjD/DUF883 family membrane-anchored ribosome-binding protein